MFLAQRLLVGPGKQLKQIIQTEQNTVQNPNKSRKQIQAFSRVELQPDTARLVFYYKPSLKFCM